MTPENKMIFAGLADIHLLALCIFGEARGENLLGKAAVGWVVLNRLHDQRWPNTLQEVILQPKQFSCFLESDPNFPKLLERAQRSRFHDKSPSWRECQYVAYGVLCNWIIDPTAGANHYHTTAIDPDWNKGMQLTVLVGHHEFYKA